MILEAFAGGFISPPPFDEFALEMDPHYLDRLEREAPGIRQAWNRTAQGQGYELNPTLQQGFASTPEHTRQLQWHEVVTPVGQGTRMGTNSNTGGVTMTPQSLVYQPQMSPAGTVPLSPPAYPETPQHSPGTAAAAHVQHVQLMEEEQERERQKEELKELQRQLKEQQDRQLMETEAFQANAQERYDQKLQEQKLQAQQPSAAAGGTETPSTAAASVL